MGRESQLIFKRRLTLKLNPDFSLTDFVSACAIVAHAARGGTASVNETRALVNACGGFKDSFTHGRAVIARRRTAPKQSRARTQQSGLLRRLRLLAMTQSEFSFIALSPRVDASGESAP
jgi:hypothetical protein